MAATCTRNRSTWTPRDVANALMGYTQLAADTSAGLIRAVRLDDGAYQSCGRSPIERDAARKADIELAIERLPVHIERVMALYFLRGLHSCRYVADAMKGEIGYVTVSRRRKRGIALVASDLCQSDQAGSEIFEYIR